MYLVELRVGVMLQTKKTTVQRPCGKKKGDPLEKQKNPMKLEFRRIESKMGRESGEIRTD